MEHDIRESSMEISEARTLIGNYYRQFISTSAAYNLKEATFKENIKFERVEISKYLGFMEFVVNRACLYEQEKKERYYEKLNDLKRQIYEKEKMEKSSKERAEMSSFDPNKSKKGTEIQWLEKIERIGKSKKQNLKPIKQDKTPRKGKIRVSSSMEFSNNQNQQSNRKNRNLLLMNKRKKQNDFKQTYSIDISKSREKKGKGENFKNNLTSSESRRTGKSRWRVQSSYHKSHRENLKSSLHYILGVPLGKFDSKSVQILYSNEDVNKKNNKILDLKKFKMRNIGMFNQLGDKSLMMGRVKSLQESIKDVLSTKENSRINSAKVTGIVVEDYEGSKE